MKRRVKVMADYSAFPLWLDSPAGFPGPVSTESIPLSPALRQRLEAWADEYDRCALSEVWADLVNDWNQRGLDLSTDLANELGHEWDVVYFDEITGDEIAVPVGRGRSTRA